MEMKKGDVWEFGREFFLMDEDGEKLRSFRGFLEHGGLSGRAYKKSRAGLVSKEKFRLISEPCEDFLPFGAGAKIYCEGCSYELISSFEVYAGKALSHRESVLRRWERDG
jgi:hypothetical protein